MIVITGATGKVGRNLVAGLAGEGLPVRALTRVPAAARMPAGAHAVYFDSARPESFASALADATAVFVNPAALGGSAAEFLAAAKSGGAPRAVMLSSFAVRDHGPQTSSIGTHHKHLEDVIEESGLDWTFLRCGGFATNTLAWAPAIRAERVVRAPYGKAATALISERDIAAAATRVLADDGHSRATYVLTGQQSLTQIEHADAIGAAIGRSLRFEELPPGAFRQAASQYLSAAAVDDLLRYYADYVGRMAEMSPEVEKLIGRPATTFAEWAVQHAADFQ
jgi:uncharacterized protein YbjT (DUF2867 family)